MEPLAGGWDHSATGKHRILPDFAFGRLTSTAFLARTSPIRPILVRKSRDKPVTFFA
jgi:hypothetical protein